MPKDDYDKPPVQALVVRHDGDEKPPATGELAVVLSKTSELLAAGSPLEDLAVHDRERVMLAVLELAAISGDVQAAELWLRHERWRREMEKGKPPQRKVNEHRGSITLVDNLSRRGAPPRGTFTELGAMGVLGVGTMPKNASPLGVDLEDDPDDGA